MPMEFVGRAAPDLRLQTMELAKEKFGYLRLLVAAYGSS